jgi:hypothetical protein
MTTTEHQTPGNASNRPSDATKEHLNTLAGDAAATLETAKQQGAQQYEQLRDLATEQIDSLVEGAQSAASAFEGKDTLGLSQYLGDIASSLGSFADQVREKSAEDLLHQSAKLARDNPALFLAGSVAIGFGLSRFLRASSDQGSSTSGSPSTGEHGGTPSSASQFSGHQPVAQPATTAQQPLSAGAGARGSNLPDPLGEEAIHPSSDTHLGGNKL